MHLELRPFLPLWWLFAIQFLGLASAWFARVHVGSRRQGLAHAAFLLFMALVGITTVTAAMTSPSGSLVCGTTLSVMVLAAVWDFDNGKKALAR